MEFFPDGTHVRLRSRPLGTYFYAEEDGVSINMSPNSASPNAVWAVHRLERGGNSYVLFRGAAYGRYLALHLEPDQDQGAPPGPPGQGVTVHCCAVQRAYYDAGQDDVLWEVRSAGDGSDDVLLRNNKYGKLRNLDDYRRSMHWMVEAIPPRADPPELPPLTPPPAPIGGPMSGMRRIVPPQVLYRRMIHYVRADDQGDFNQLAPAMLWFDGRSAFNLRTELAAQLGEANDQGITLCVRAGSNGRLTPLITDLPANEQPMDIVVLITGSLAAEALVYPNVDAP